MRMGFVVLALVGFVGDGDAKRRQCPIRKHILGEFRRAKIAGGCGGNLVGESDEHQCDRAEDAQCPLFDLSPPPDQDSLFDRSDRAF